MLAIGSIYGWSVVSKQLGAVGYTKSETGLMGTIGTLSVYVTFFTGEFFDKFGPRATILLSLLVTCGGWGAILLCVKNKAPAEWIVLSQILVGQGVQPGILTAQLNGAHFSQANAGFASAFTLTGFGLTSVCMAQIDNRIFHSKDIEGLLLTMVIATGTLIVVQFVTYLPAPSKKQTSESTVHVSGTQIAKDIMAAIENEPCSAPVRTRTKHLIALVKERDSLLLFFVITAFGMSLYFFVVNLNALNIAAGEHEKTSYYVTVFGLCNVIARPVTGFVYDRLNVAYTQFLILGIVLVCVAMVLMGLQLTFAGAFMMGTSDGFMFAVIFPLTKEMHGLKSYGLTLSCHLFLVGVGDLLQYGFGAIYAPDLVVHGNIVPLAFVCVAFDLLAIVAAVFLNRIRQQKEAMKQKLAQNGMSATLLDISEPGSGLDIANIVLEPSRSVQDLDENVR